MFESMQIPVMLGGGADMWALNADGSLQVKTPITNDTSVQFTNVPYDENFGYVLYVDMDFQGAVAGTPEIKRTGKPVVTNISNGLCTITIPITTVTSAQVGAQLRLRIVK